MSKERNRRLRELLQARSRYLRTLTGTGPRTRNGAMGPPITSRNVRRALENLAELAAGIRKPGQAPDHARRPPPVDASSRRRRHHAVPNYK